MAETSSWRGLLVQRDPLRGSDKGRRRRSYGPARASGSDRRTGITRFIADGAYEGTPTSDLLKARFGDAVEIIIPRPKNAICSPQLAHDPSARDQHIVEIQTHRRLAWQTTSGYNQRSRGETQIGRWKGVIGSKLKARSFENQKTEVRIGVRVLNKMTELGRPEFEVIR